MSDKLYIHVGAGKTGTSAIQKFLLINRDLLEKRGVFIFPGGLTVNKGMLAHHGLADHTVKVKGDVFELWRELGNSTGKNFLISSEFFHSKIQAGGGREYFRDVKSIVKKDIKIIFYIRRQSQWMQSAYSQWVQGKEKLSLEFNEFVNSYPKNIAQQVVDFAECFGNENVIVRPFQKESFVGGSIFSDFLNCINVRFDDSFLIPSGNANPRLSVKSLELKRLANANVNDGKVVNIIGKRLLDYSKEKSDSKEIFFDHDLIDSDAQVEMEKNNEALYQYISRNIIGDDTGDLFKDDYFEKMKEKSLQVNKKYIDLSDDPLVYLVFKLYEDFYKK